MNSQTLKNIFNDPKLLSKQKLIELKEIMEQRQKNLNYQLSSHIKNQVFQFHQIQSLNVAKKTIEESSIRLLNSQKRLQNLHKIWAQENKLHEQLKLFNKMAIFKKNLSNTIDQIKILHQIDQQINGLQQMVQYQQKLSQVHQKLIVLTNLRDNVINKVKTQKSGVQIKILQIQFARLNEFQKRFHQKVFNELSNPIALVRKSKVALEGLVKIIQSGDDLLIQQKKNPWMVDKCLEKIKKGIDQKFANYIGNNKSISQIMSKCKFVVPDLIEVLDNVSKHFSPKYQIFKLYQQSYRKNVQQKILPILQNQEEVKENYGNLITLLSWIDNYENFMLKSGVDSSQFVYLKSKAKYYMPFFIDHLHKLFSNYCKNSINDDKEQCIKKEYIDKLIQQQKELESHFPSDIFHFINQQIDLLAQQIKGQLFMQFLRTISQTLQCQLTQQISSIKINIELSDPQYLHDYQNILILYINNFHLCMKSTIESKKHCLQYTDLKFKQRIQGIYNRMLKQINSLIENLIFELVKTIFAQLNQEVFPFYFTDKWYANNNQLFEITINTVTDQVQFFQGYFTNPIHLKILIKQCYQFVLNSLFECLIFVIDKQYPGILKKWTKKYIWFKVDQKKKEKQKQTKINLKQLIKRLQLDCSKLMKIFDTRLTDHISSAQKNRLQNKIIAAIQLFTKKPQKIMQKAQQICNLYTFGYYLVECILCIRNDITGDQVHSILNKINKYQII